jgi:hypothetical protein
LQGLWWPIIAVAVSLCVVCPGQASARPVATEKHARTVCEIISKEAQRRALPEAFLARLIWKESAFNPGAVSPKGAQGIAQFMPSTADERGLGDPFQPAQALPASASLLSELRALFGNLGLAAAAYNAGEKRVRDWLDGRGGLPAETRDYVFSITGRAASDWAETAAGYVIPPIGKGADFLTDCVQLASRGAAPAPPGPRTRSGKWKPWGIQVAGSHSEAVALASFERLKSKFADLLAGADPLVIRKRNPGMGPRRMVNVRIGADSRSEADRLCAKLLAQGGACVVLKN